MSDVEPDGPKYRIEHASSGQATCQQAACKRAGSKIAKGELRIGTNTLFNRDEEMRWYMAWRHWACATPHQIRGLKEMAEDDVTKTTGYDRLSTESQEQLKLAFEEGRVADKDFKDVRSDLAGPVRLAGGTEILDAEGYKVDMPVRPAGCRATDCGNKIVKDELRVGFLRSFDGDHSSWVYKHWYVSPQAAASIHGNNTSKDLTLSADSQQILDFCRKKFTSQINDINMDAPERGFKSSEREVTAWMQVTILLECWRHVHAVGDIQARFFLLKSNDRLHLVAYRATTRLLRQWKHTQHTCGAPIGQMLRRRGMGAIIKKSSVWRLEARSFTKQWIKLCGFVVGPGKSS